MASITFGRTGVAVLSPDSGADRVILKARRLVKVYRTGSEEYPAVRGVDLECRKGDFTVIVGASGSGKSTLLYLLSGLDSPTSGEVWLAGRKLNGMSPRELAKLRTHKIGYVYQAINLIPDLSILDNIAFPGYLAGKPRSGVRERALALMRKFDIAGLADRLPSQVSGGQQQRAAIARALINEPDLLFADEPTGALSQQQGTIVLDLLTELNRGGQSIVMVTHDLRAACRADRLILVKDGVISGNLDLPKYDGKDMSAREQQIYQFMRERE
jgi:putative ABC transport system ATP-binding protein